MEYWFINTFAPGAVAFLSFSGLLSLCMQYSNRQYILVHDTIPGWILVGGLEHFLFSHILGIIIPIDFHMFQRGSNHQPDTDLFTSGTSFHQRHPQISGISGALSQWLSPPEALRRAIENTPKSYEGINRAVREAQAFRIRCWQGLFWERIWAFYF